MEEFKVALLNTHWDPLSSDFHDEKVPIGISEFAVGRPTHFTGRNPSQYDFGDKANPKENRNNGIVELWNNGLIQHSILPYGFYHRESNR